MSRILLTLALALSLSGCALRNRMFPPAPFSDRAPCAIPTTLSKEQLVLHLNKNIQGSATSSGLVSWRSMNARITATGMPPGISVPASIAVEAPRNFRLRVSEPLTRVEALDMGSNPEHFWFWAKDARPQQVITVNHGDMSSAQRELRIPFHPDWLMEVLGVIPLDASQFALSRGRADAPTLELICESITPSGEARRKVIRVDACHGIIREHALYDSRGLLIARAALADHRVDPATGLIVPHVISFDWPAMQQQMKMVFGTVELNPPQMPPQLWQIPQKPGAPQMDLSRLLGESGAGQPSLYGVGSPFGSLPPHPPGAREPAVIAPAGHAEVHRTDSAAQTPYEPGVVGDAEEPATIGHADETPRASRTGLTHPEVTAPSASGLPAAYLPAASQSSSAPPRPGQALWRRPQR